MVYFFFSNDIINIDLLKKIDKSITFIKGYTYIKSNINNKKNLFLNGKIIFFNIELEEIIEKINKYKLYKNNEYILYKTDSFTLFNDNLSRKYNTYIIQ